MEFLSYLENLMNWFSFITTHPHFDNVAGLLALANPFALAPALLAIYRSHTAEGQSVLMWIIFLIIQVVFALVGAKAGNLGAFISMSVSVFMSLTAIGMLFVKHSRLPVVSNK